MNSVTLFNKIGVTLYSTLTSILSGINHLIDHDQLGAGTTEQSGNQRTAPAPEDIYIPERLLTTRWQTIQQAFLSLLLWVTLGLAAGFLLGMIKGGY